MSQAFAIVIPSLNPDGSLPGYVAALREKTDAPIILVDDGSREVARAFFQQCVSDVPNVSLLTHPVNRGKGRALKTAFAHLLEAMPHLEGCVTCDSDGQHAPDDVVRCLAALKENPDALVLGCRTFNLSHVPWKSRLGNKVTCALFRLATGREIRDTQTGLRALPAAFMREMLYCPGERFEFETYMLLRLRDRAIIQLPIETLYVNGNRETHFDPLRDSARIMSIVLGAGCLKLAKFALASALSFGVDIGLFTLFYYKVFGEGTSGRLFLSVALARGISLVFNYCCNRYFVFGEVRGGPSLDGASFGRYLVLAATIMAASYALTRLSHHVLPGAPLPWVKAGVDLVLFLASYGVQRLVIFRPQNRPRATCATALK